MKRSIFVIQLLLLLFLSSCNNSINQDGIIEVGFFVNTSKEEQTVFCGYKIDSMFEYSEVVQIEFFIGIPSTLLNDSQAEVNILVYIESSDSKIVILEISSFSDDTFSYTLLDEKSGVKEIDYNYSTHLELNSEFFTNDESKINIGYDVYIEDELGNDVFYFGTAEELYYSFDGDTIIINEN